MPLDAKVEAPKSKASPSLLAKLTVSLASLILTLLACEAGVRIFSPQDSRYWDSSFFSRLQSQAPHFAENIPGAHTNFIGVPVSINSLGLRDAEIAIPKPPHTTRIVAVGDSITFGYGVKLENTYAKVIEHRLNAEDKTGIHYEVLNGGTLGGALGDYLNFLRKKAEQFQPDIVLIGLCLNDILVYSQSGATVESGADWGNERAHWIRPINRLLLRHSQLYLLVYSSLKKAMYRFGVLDANMVQGQNLVALAPSSSYQAKAWESSLAMLGQISSFCRDRGYKLLVIVFPGQMQMSAADMDFYRRNYHIRFDDRILAGEPQRRLLDFAIASHLSMLDLLPAFRRFDSRQLFLHNDKIPTDPFHPSVLGNEVAAEQIVPALRNMM